MGERITLTHGLSLSNLPLFVAEGANLFAAEGLEVEVPRFDKVASSAGLLASGEAQLGTMGFISPLMSFDRADPPIIVAGSGLMGVALLAQPSTTGASQLKARKVGTFRGDPMEVLAYDAIRAAGLAFNAVEVQYLETLPQALDLFARGELAAVTVVEPHAMRMRRRGAVELSDGTDVWGRPFPDTVLVTTASFLDRRPDAVRAAIRAMLKAEAMIEQDLVGALAFVRGHYPDFSLDELAEGARNQPPCVDIRHLTATVFDRWPSMQALGLVPSDAPPPESAMSLDLLAQEVEASSA